MNMLIICPIWPITRMNSRSLSASFSCLLSSNSILLLSKFTYTSLDSTCASSISLTILLVAFSACCTFVVLFLFFFGGISHSSSDSLFVGPGVAVQSEGPGVAVQPEGPGVAVQSEGPGVAVQSVGPGVAVRPEGPGVAVRPEGPGVAVWPEGPWIAVWPEGPGVAVQSEGLEVAVLFVVEKSGVVALLTDRLGVAVPLPEVTASNTCATSLSQESTRCTGATDGLPPNTACIWL